MARILYAVEKEGLGHAVRSAVIIKELSKKHKLKIVAGGKPYRYLSKQFRNIHHIDNFDLIYTHNSANIPLTVISNLVKSPFTLLYNLKLIRVISEFRPHVIITDFEPFSNYLAPLFKIPLISIDNQHMLTKCSIAVPKKFKKDYLLACFVISTMVNKADRYIVTSFFKAKPKKSNTIITPPILREKILKAKPKSKGHILVYQTSKTYEGLLEILKTANQEFIVYGFNKSIVDKNLTFRKFNKDIFFKDLTESKAVITNGGFTLITEAIYLNKPILSIPIRKQFEQILNALQVKKLGYGEYHPEITKEIVGNFIKNMGKYIKRLKTYKKHDNLEIIKALDRAIKELTIKS